MRRTLTTEPIPIKLWLDDMDEGALQQARNLANLPSAFHHVAIMPDAHFGYGMPIGGILATNGVVIPNGVGVDIGCGVCAVKTSLSAIDRPTLKQVMKTIRTSVPLGFKHLTRPVAEKLMPTVKTGRDERLIVVEQEYDNARTQAGTLGGGNHFIEFQQAGDQRIWFMVHSGSRNLGYKVAHHYNQIATALNRKRSRPIPPSWQLDGLPLDSTEGQRYLAEMNYCVRFAGCNRQLMVARIQESLLDGVGADISFAEPIDVAHNYAAAEHHFGTEVMVHRKGAIRACHDDIGIIPGSQGAASYIVSGNGNPESFCSCSHGAGRTLGRRQARKQLDLEKEKKMLEARGILHALRRRQDLEEAAGAYKDIETVIRLQQDLVDVLEIVQPLAVIKG
ncbi:MAG: RtcB family protein [Desulfocapsaceae bacterium]|jgi:tRNA-splicing ligase RtcB|nr:RtcB family protein [Desulfocapsaceae bacterium]